jgi:hypothetical protein
MPPHAFWMQLPFDRLAAAPGRTAQAPRPGHVDLDVACAVASHLAGISRLSLRVTIVQPAVSRFAARSVRRLERSSHVSPEERPVQARCLEHGPPVDAFGETDHPSRPPSHRWRGISLHDLCICFDEAPEAIPESRGLAGADGLKFIASPITARLGKLYVMAHAAPPPGTARARHSQGAHWPVLAHKRWGSLYWARLPGRTVPTRHIPPCDSCPNQRSASASHPQVMERDRLVLPLRLNSELPTTVSGSPAYR